MSLGTGNWTFNGGGSGGNFSVTAVDNKGNVKGTLDGQDIQGFYDANSRKLVFMRTDPNDPSAIQVFTGQLFSFVLVDFEKSTLVGTVETVSGSGPQVQVSIDGWYASMGRVIT